VMFGAGEDHYRRAARRSGLVGRNAEAAGRPVLTRRAAAAAQRRTGLLRLRRRAPMAAESWRPKRHARAPGLLRARSCDTATSSRCPARSCKFESFCGPSFARLTRLTLVDPTSNSAAEC
jgi:hypothetical protein